MHTATFVCLANSRKHNGRCLAGKALFNGTYSKWIRPVTEHPSEELQSHEHCLQSGEDSSILDLLEIQLLQPKGKQHQGLLIAGHIKPWAKSDDSEKLDPKNGLVFTPTYDRLFNNGLISFTEQCALIISPLLSRETSTRLHIHPNMELDIPMHGQSNKPRQEYMEYHREFILRK